MLQLKFITCELHQAEEIYTGAVREVKEETGVSLYKHF
jgi:8-oxo-dGTP pyrophosphatase MutT (NUDIX family)